jgi:hypothetical protein
MIKRYINHEIILLAWEIVQINTIYLKYFNFLTRINTCLILSDMQQMFAGNLHINTCPMYKPAHWAIQPMQQTKDTENWCITLPTKKLLHVFLPAGTYWYAYWQKINAYRQTWQKSKFIHLLVHIMFCRWS